ncbi:MAG: ATP synthase F1 subunit delta [Oscillospiraceae bacterium]|nr:ATP synthase F1 subunit delta [Oscillospiraceae bacterium]
MTQIANAYAQGLYQLAKDEGLTEELLQELTTLQTGFAEEPAIYRLLSTPNLSKEERLGVLDSSFRGKVHPYVLNFLKILTERGYIAHFPDCCVAFRAQYNEDSGILPVSAVTAVPMTEQQQARLTEKLTSLTGKTVELTNRVDPDCLGGVRLDYDGKRVDGTVKNRLDDLAKALRG